MSWGGIDYDVHDPFTLSILKTSIAGPSGDTDVKGGFHPDGQSEVVYP